MNWTLKTLSLSFIVFSFSSLGLGLKLDYQLNYTSYVHPKETALEFDVYTGFTQVFSNDFKLNVEVKIGNKFSCVNDGCLLLDTGIEDYYLNRFYILPEDFSLSNRGFKFGFFRKPLGYLSEDRRAFGIVPGYYYSILPIKRDLGLSYTYYVEKNKLNLEAAVFYSGIPHLVVRASKYFDKSKGNMVRATLSTPPNSLKGYESFGGVDFSYSFEENFRIFGELWLHIPVFDFSHFWQKHSWSAYTADEFVEDAFPEHETRTGYPQGLLVGYILGKLKITDSIWTTAGLVLDATDRNNDLNINSQQQKINFMFQLEFKAFENAAFFVEYNSISDTYAVLPDDSYEYGNGQRPGLSFRFQNVTEF